MQIPGTRTFLFCDIEGATLLLQRLGSEPYGALLEREVQILGDACTGRGGQLVDQEGDGCVFVFVSAAAAVMAAAEAQHALHEEPFPEPVNVRMGVHTGEVSMVGDRYVGVAVHRAARICAVAVGGQVLVSRTTRDVVAGALPTGLELQELGRRKLKGLEGLERLFVLRGELPQPGSTLESVQASNVPAAASALHLAGSGAQHAAAMLREELLQGRLTLGAFSARLDELRAARTDAQVAAVVREPSLVANPPGRHKRRAWLLTLFGSEQRRGTWRVPERMISFSLLGSPDLDFRHAFMTIEEAKITSIALVGSLTALVPSGIDVDLGGFCLFGGNDFVTGDDVPPTSLGPRLRIRCFSLFGGAAVSHVRAEEARGGQAPDARL